jgi:hypothetical protein
MRRGTRPSETAIPKPLRAPQGPPARGTMWGQQAKAQSPTSCEFIRRAHQRKVDRSAGSPPAESSGRPTLQLSGRRGEVQHRVPLCTSPSEHRRMYGGDDTRVCVSLVSFPPID